jgi:hypothetical protein
LFVQLLLQHSPAVVHPAPRARQVVLTPPSPLPPKTLLFRPPSPIGPPPLLAMPLLLPLLVPLLPDDPPELLDAPSPVVPSFEPPSA